MIKSISEKQAISILGIDQYFHICKTIAESDSQSDDFKNCNDPIFFNSSIYNKSNDEFILIQSTINRSALPLIDFGIHAMFISDDKQELIDKQLDLYNSLKSKFNIKIK